MSKTKIYFSILIVAVAIAALGYIMNIAEIKSFVSQCLNYAGNNIISVSAAVCTFIFLGNKRYWFVLLGCSVITSLVLQFAIIGHGAGMIATLAQITAFLSIGFIMNLIKIVVNK